MKLKNVKSQYANPDRLIKSLRKQLDRATKKLKKDWDKFQEYRETQEANAPKTVIFWKAGVMVEQSLQALSPDKIHVGVTIQQIGRIVEVLERLNSQGQPVTTFKYELKYTKAAPSVITTGDELEENKK